MAVGLLAVLAIILLACDGRESVAPPLPPEQEEERFDVTLAGDGNASGRIVVTSSDGDLTCEVGKGNSCRASFLDGTAVQLEARPTAPVLFDEWQDDAAGCGNQAICILVITRPMTIRARFFRLPPPAEAAL